jgi:hypothetical protein
MMACRAIREVGDELLLIAQDYDARAAELEAEMAASDPNRGTAEPAPE